MAVLSKGAKGAVGFKAAKGAARNPGIVRKGAKGAIGFQAVRGVAKNPGVVKFGAKAGKPVAKFKVRQGVRRIERFGEAARDFGEAARDFGETLAEHGPQAAQELGLIEAPKPKRTAPRVAAGVVIGASAVYFLEPEHGREHREKVMNLVA